MCLKSILGVENPDWIIILAGILILDNLWNHHVLLLRAENRPGSYIFFNLLNVILTMALNILLVVKWDLGIEGVLISNLVSVEHNFYFFVTNNNKKNKPISHKIKCY